MTTRTSIVAGLILSAGLLSSCAGGSGADAGEWPAYPGPAQAAVVDVQVFRDGPTLSFTNTSDRTLGPGLLWVNAAYSIEIGAVEPGANATIDLNSCRNEFGQPFRGGGFFATERPDEVVLAQVEDGSGMTGLLVTTRPGAL